MKFLYTAADFELDECHVIKNEKVALDRLRVRQKSFCRVVLSRLVMSEMILGLYDPTNMSALKDWLTLVVCDVGLNRTNSSNWTLKEQSTQNRYRPMLWLYCRYQLHDLTSFRIYGIETYYHMSLCRKYETIIYTTFTGKPAHSAAMPVLFFYRASAHWRANGAILI